MTQSDPSSRRPKTWTALAAAAVAGATAVTLALPPTAAADPVPPPPPAPTTAPPPPPPADPAQPVPPPPPADPNAALPAPVDGPAAPAEPAAPPADPAALPPAAPVDPNAPAPGPAPGPADAATPVATEAGRVENAAGGFSYILPAGWEAADASRLSYGQALLLKQTGPAPLPGQPAQTATDTSILLGRLDMKLFAGAEQDNEKAAVRLASDMGEFFMPFAGTRLNQQTASLQAGDMSGSASSYDVKFTDTAKPNGQIWAGVVGTPGAGGDPGSRWFVVWLGTANEPIDTGAATALAESIRPYTAPAAPAAPGPDPNAPAPAPDPNAPAPDPNAPAPDPNAPAPDPNAPAPDPNAPAPAPAPEMAPPA